MSITIGSNIASLKALRQLGEITGIVTNTFERLSSGQRINKASDDAAGLAVAATLENDRRVFTQGIRNLNDGISLLSVADAAVEQLSTIVTRLKELAEQAANGTYGAKQRQALDSEAQSLSDEYFRIARSTTFNGRGLFYSEFGQLRLQGGYGTEGGIQSGLGGAIGTGTVGSAITSTATGVTEGVLGDLNGDGLLDMAMATSAGGIAVRLGQGGGSFGSSLTFTSGMTLISAIELGDLDNDGVLDLVAVGGGFGADDIGVLLGRGDGTFGAATVYDSDLAGERGVALGDVNGDGFLDIATTGQTRTYVRLGTGTGTFGTAVSYSAASGLSSDVAFGDMNGDGLLDLVSVGYDATLNVRYWVNLGRGDGTFQAGTSFSMGSGLGQGVALADLNNDGLLDVATSAVNTIGSANFVSVRLNTGNNTYGTAVNYATGGQSDVEFADLNGDGALDLIASGAVVVRLGTGSGTFGSAATYGSLADLTIGDVNNDGVPDIGGVSTNTVATFLTQTTSGVQPLLPFDIRSMAGARAALSIFTQKLDQLASQRGTIGAFQSRIGVATSVLQATSDNYGAAAGRIMDADIAEEAATLARTQILQQAAAAVLGQANQQPALALKLLQLE